MVALATRVGLAEMALVGILTLLACQRAGQESYDAGQEEGGGPEDAADGQAGADDGEAPAPDGDSTPDAPPPRTCLGPGEDPGRQSVCSAETFPSGGRTRGAIVCRPEPLPAGPLPLVLAFHGGGGNAARWQASIPWHETAARHGFVAVFMQGCREALTDCSAAQGSYLWNVGKAGEPSAIDDQRYTLDLLAHLETALGLEIDPGCRFATGHSLGGIFTYSLMCDRPELLTAIGPISAPPTDQTCTPHAGTSIHHLHGALDENVPFHTGCCSAAQQTAGDPEYQPACAALPRCFNPSNWWPPVRSGDHPFAQVTGLDALAFQGLGCRGEPEVLSQTGGVTCLTYPGCAPDRAAEFCLLDGVDHNLAALNTVLDVRAHLWARFAAHPAR